MKKTHKRLIWGVGAASSLWLSWLAIRGPEEPAQQAIPPALVRPATNAEKQTVRNMLSKLQAQLDDAKTRTGAWPTLGEIEATDPTGQPWLPDGLPDNPLVPGISNVADGCTDGATAQADWLYCASTGRIHAGGAVLLNTPP